MSQRETTKCSSRPSRLRGAYSCVITIIVLAALGGCSTAPSGPIPEATYIQFVSVEPPVTSVLSPGQTIAVRAKVLARHKYEIGDIGLYVQEAPGKLVNEPTFVAIPPGGGEYQLEQTFTVPQSSQIYLVAALYERGESKSQISDVVAWRVQ